MDNKSKVTKQDPWQKLAGTGPMKDVPLGEVLKKLEVSANDAPAVKRQLLDQVRKITKRDR